MPTNKQCTPISQLVLLKAADDAVDETAKQLRLAENLHNEAVAVKAVLRDSLGLPAQGYSRQDTAVLRRYNAAQASVDGAFNNG